jgi:hypothetical protein
MSSVSKRMCRSGIDYWDRQRGRRCWFQSRHMRRKGADARRDVFPAEVLQHVPPIAAHEEDRSQRIKHRYRRNGGHE